MTITNTYCSAMLISTKRNTRPANIHYPDGIKRRKILPSFLDAINQTAQHIIKNYPTKIYRLLTICCEGEYQTARTRQSVRNITLAFTNPQLNCTTQEKLSRTKTNNLLMLFKEEVSYVYNNDHEKFLRINANVLELKEY